MKPTYTFEEALDLISEIQSIDLMDALRQVLVEERKMYPLTQIEYLIKQCSLKIRKLLLI